MIFVTREVGLPVFPFPWGFVQAPYCGAQGTGLGKGICRLHLARHV